MVGNEASSRVNVLELADRIRKLEQQEQQRPPATVDLSGLDFDQFEGQCNPTSFGLIAWYSGQLHACVGLAPGLGVWHPLQLQGVQQSIILELLAASTLDPGALLGPIGSNRTHTIEDCIRLGGTSVESHLDTVTQETEYFCKRRNMDSCSGYMGPGMDESDPWQSYRGYSENAPNHCDHFARDEERNCQAGCCGATECTTTVETRGFSQGVWQDRSQPPSQEALDSGAVCSYTLGCQSWSESAGQRTCYQCSNDKTEYCWPIVLAVGCW